jgi:hypothetical protein
MTSPEVTCGGFGATSGTFVRIQSAAARMDSSRSQRGETRARAMPVRLIAGEAAAWEIVASVALSGREP